MDISSLNSLLTPLPTTTSQDSSVASAATDGTAPDPTKVSSSTGQDLPSSEQSTAASATVGPSTATLSPDIQALLLQTQEATAAVSFLNSGSSSDQDSLLSMLGGNTQSTGDSSLDDILAELQGTNGTQGTSATSSLADVLAALPGTDGSQALSGSALDDVLSALQGTSSTQSTSGTPSADSGLDAVLAALQGTSGTASATSQDPLLSSLQGTNGDQSDDVMQILMQNMGVNTGVNSTIDNTTQSLLNLMNSDDSSASDPMLASLE